MELFVKAPKEIMYCQGVIDQDGELVKLLPVDKLVYFHMLDRKKLFTDRGSKHFESQEGIASVLGIDRKTANRSLTKLLQAGLIFGHKETHPSRGYSHWVYTDVNTSPNVYGDKRKNTSIENTATLDIPKGSNVPSWEDEPPPF